MFCSDFDCLCVPDDATAVPLDKPVTLVTADPPSNNTESDPVIGLVPLIQLTEQTQEGDCPQSIWSGILPPTFQFGTGFQNYSDNQWKDFMEQFNGTLPQFRCPKFLCTFTSEHSADVKTHIATIHDKQAKFLLSCLHY